MNRKNLLNMTKIIISIIILLLFFISISYSIWFLRYTPKEEYKYTSEVERIFETEFETLSMDISFKTNKPYFIVNENIKVTLKLGRFLNQDIEPKNYTIFVHFPEFFGEHWNFSYHKLERVALFYFNKNLNEMTETLNIKYSSPEWHGFFINILSESDPIVDENNYYYFSNVIYVLSPFENIQLTKVEEQTQNSNRTNGLGYATISLTFIIILLSIYTIFSRNNNIEKNFSKNNGHSLINSKTKLHDNIYQSHHLNRLKLYTNLHQQESKKSMRNEKNIIVKKQLGFKILPK